MSADTTLTDIVLTTTPELPSGGYTTAVWLDRGSAVVRFDARKWLEIIKRRRIVKLLKELGGR